MSEVGPGVLRLIGLSVSVSGQLLQVMVNMVYGYGVRARLAAFICS